MSFTTHFIKRRVIYKGWEYMSETHLCNIFWTNFLRILLRKNNKCVSHWSSNLAVWRFICLVFFCWGTRHHLLQQWGRWVSTFPSTDCDVHRQLFGRWVHSISPAHKPQSAALTPYKYWRCVSATALSELDAGGESGRGGEKRCTGSLGSARTAWFHRWDTSDLQKSSERQKCPFNRVWQTKY